MASKSVSAITRTAVSLEYASIHHKQHCPLGMYIVPSIKNLLIWDGVFFVHQGYYADAILKFRIVFPQNYPEKIPSVQFITETFHPLVDTNSGDFNMAPRFRPWRPKENHVFEILHYIKAAFKKHTLDKISASDCFNKEAFRYRNSTSSFAALATQSSALSKSASALFDSDHPTVIGKATSDITFRELTKGQLQQAREDLALRTWNEDDQELSLQ